MRLDVAGTPPTLGPPPVGDEVPTIVGRRSSHEALALAPGFRLGHFEVIEAIGAGGMATVLKARDLELGRIVALKILPPDSARDPDSVTRFKQEGRAAAKLDHDNVARVFFCGEDKGLHFIAFEYVEGVTLRALIDQSGTVPPADCIRYLLQLAAGLQHASDRGVIHRDVKPSNIVVTPDGRAKLIDMGLARQQGSHSVNGGITQSGMTLGTFDYISPEQALDPRSVDVRSDIYSLGCAFYHALTGRPPVPEGTAAKKLHAHQHEPPTDPRLLNPSIPDALAVVLSGMMVKARDRRYASPDALIRDLLAVADSLAIPLDPSTIPTSSARAGTSQVRTLTRPDRPRMPLGLIVGIGVAIAAAVVLIVGLRGTKAPAPAWDDDTAKTERTNRILDLPNPGAPNVPSQQTLQPATTDALLAALAQSNVTIQLESGKVYDLSQTPGVVFAGRDLVIESQPGTVPATLKLAASSVLEEKPTTVREGGLTVTGAQSVRFQGVRFVLTQKPGTDEEVWTAPVGILVEGTAKLEVLQCHFELDSAATASDGVGILFERGARPDAGTVSVRNTSVALRRWVGFELAGAARAEFTECGFAISRAGIRLSGHGVTSSVGLQSCTFLIEKSGVAVDVLDTVAATVRAGYSVFASADTEPPGMMMPEPNERRPALLRTAVASRPTATAIPTQPCAFYRVDVPADWDAPVELKQHPWASANPLAKLDKAEPWRAFELNPRWNQLRVANREVQIMGVKQLPTEATKIYGTWPPGGTQSDAVPTGVRIWYPNPPAAERESLPANVFDNLAQAMAALKPGDKLLIRGSGAIEVPTQTVIAKPDSNVTIRPEDDNATLVLTPGDTNRLDSTMFRLEEGDLRFERIEFRLKPAAVKAGDLKSQSIVTLAAGGRRCEFSRCIITMEQQSDEILSAVRLVDISAEMRKTETVRRPLVRMEDCVLRGRGRAVWATTAFPFDLAATNVLLALSAPVVELEAPDKPYANGSIIGVQLSQVTALLGAGLIDMRCGKPADDKPGPFVPVEIRTDGCLFIPVGAVAAPVATVAGGDPTQWERYVNWNVGTPSGYGNFPENGALLEVVSEELDGKTKRLDIASGLQFAKEKASGAGKVTLVRMPDDADDLAKVRPDQVAVKQSTFGATVGCRVKELPKPSR